MKVGGSIGVIGKEREFFWGKIDAKYSLLELSGTVLTLKVSLYVKV